jgi:hypothetical protein
VSPSDDRVAVPTNGHHPAMSDVEEPGTERGTATPPTVTTDRGPRAIVPAVSPAQLAAGFGIIAAVILLVLGRRRSRRD